MIVPSEWLPAAKHRVLPPAPWRIASPTPTSGLDAHQRHLRAGQDAGMTDCRVPAAITIRLWSKACKTST